MDISITHEYKIGYGYIRAPSAVIETGLICKLKASVMPDRVVLEQSHSTFSSIFICFCKQQLRLAEIDHVIYFSQSQLLFVKTNEDRTTTSRNALLNSEQLPRHDDCFIFLETTILFLLYFIKYQKVFSLSCSNVFQMYISIDISVSLTI